MAKSPLSSSELAPSSDASLQDRIDTLTASLEAREAEIESLEASHEEEKTKRQKALMQLMAAKENSEKRSEKQLARAKIHALSNFAESLLPLVDSLEQAHKMAEDSPAIQEGLQMTLDLFLKTLQQYDIEIIQPLHEAFDPQWHEAMSTTEDKAHDNNTVLEVFQAGYRFQDQLLRPARVVVNKIQ